MSGYMYNIVYPTVSRKIERGVLSICDALKSEVIDASELWRVSDPKN